MTPEQSAALSKPFGPEMIRTKRGQGNREMQYVSHGGITKRLNDAAPDWSATMVERYIQEQKGALHCLGGVMRLTIGGVTREEAGGPARLGTLADDLKNTYSDCLKRCAMRFGVALDMWESAEENDEDAVAGMGADDFAAVLFDARAMVGDGKSYATIVNFLRPHKLQMSEGQVADSVAALAEIKTALAARDAAIDQRVPAGRAG